MKASLSLLLSVGLIAGAAATEGPTAPPTRYYGNYTQTWQKKSKCTEGANQGPYITVYSNNKNKYTLAWCKTDCDATVGCVGFIKTNTGCKMMNVNSTCTPQGSANPGIALYEREGDLPVTASPTTAAPTASPTDSPTASPTTGSPTDAPTGSPTRYYGNYTQVWSKKGSCTEGSKQGPYLKTFSNNKNKYTVAWCKEECDQTYDDCTGFIKTSSGCKMMDVNSTCTPKGSGNPGLAYYERTATLPVTASPTTSAPTNSPTDSPTDSPTTSSPTDAPTASPTRYYGNYTLEWNKKASCTEGSKQGPYLKTFANNKNKYTVAWCKDECDQKYDDCTGFIKTSSGCKLMDVNSACTPKGSGNPGLAYYKRQATLPITAAPTTAAPTNSPTENPTTGSPTRYFGNYTVEFEGKGGCKQNTANQKMIDTLSGQTLDTAELACDLNNDCVGVLFNSANGAAKLLGPNSKCVPKTAAGSVSVYMRAGSLPVTAAPTTASPTASPTANPTTGSPTKPGETPSPTTPKPTKPGETPKPTMAKTDAPTVDDGEGLSGGAKAGIAIGVIVGIAAAGAGIMMFGKKSEGASLEKGSETEIVASPDGKVSGHAPHDAL